MLTTQGLHTNNNSHFFLKCARFSGTPIRKSAPSSITYDRTLDHTSAGSGLTGRGRGNSGNKTNLPGVRASGLGCKKMAGVSVYVPARLMMCRCASGVISKTKQKSVSRIQAGEDEEAGRPRDVAIIVRPMWTGVCVRVAQKKRGAPVGERCERLQCACLHPRETRDACDLFIHSFPYSIAGMMAGRACPCSKSLKKSFAPHRWQIEVRESDADFRHLNRA
jgi:hypothetical protein